MTGAAVGADCVDVAAANALAGKKALRGRWLEGGEKVLTRWLEGVMQAAQHLEYLCAGCRACRYDFGRADGVLRELGLRNTQRGASNGNNGGRGGGRGGKQQGRGQRGQKQGGEDTAAAEAEAGAAGEAQADGEGQGLEPGPEPELKRQKVDDASTKSAVEPAPAGGASMAAAAATPGTDAAAVVALGAAEAKGGEAQDWAGMHVETPLKPEEKKVGAWRRDWGRLPSFFRSELC